MRIRVFTAPRMPSHGESAPSWARTLSSSAAATANGVEVTAALEARARFGPVLVAAFAPASAPPPPPGVLAPTAFRRARRAARRRFPSAALAQHLEFRLLPDAVQRRHCCWPPVRRPARASPAPSWRHAPCSARRRRRAPLVITAETSAPRDGAAAASPRAQRAAGHRNRRGGDRGGGGAGVWRAATRADRHRGLRSLRSSAGRDAARLARPAAPTSSPCCGGLRRAGIRRPRPRLRRAGARHLFPRDSTPPALGRRRGRGAAAWRRRRLALARPCRRSHTASPKARAAARTGLVRAAEASSCPSSLAQHRRATRPRL